MTEESHRSELLGSSSGKRADRPQPEAESAFSALFGGNRARGKPSQDASASHEHDAAPGKGMVQSSCIKQEQSCSSILGNGDVGALTGSQVWLGREACQAEK